MKKYTLSQAQLMIWLGQQLAPDSSQYNTIFTFEFDQRLNAEKFNLAFNQLISKCDVLKTILSEENGMAYQYINDSTLSNHSTINIENWSDNEFEDFLDKKNKQVFDLKSTIYESCLLQRENSSIWFFNIHHIFSDAWSISILYDYLGKLYHEHTDITIPSFLSSIQKADQNKSNESITQFWEQKKGLAPLSLYGSSSTNKSLQGERVHISMGKKRSAQIKELLSQTEYQSLSPQITTYNFFATISFSLLHRITNETDIVIGSPVLNRPSEVLKKTPGMFVEFLPLDPQIAPDDQFNTLFNKTKLSTFDFLKHAHPGSTTSKISNSFNVILNYIPASFPKFGSLKSTSKWISSGEFDDHHHLRIQIHDFDQTDEYHLCIDMNDEVFSKQQKECFIDHLFLTVDAFLKNPNQKISEYQILSPQENSLLKKIESAKKQENESVLSLVKKQVVNAPTAIAIIDKEHSLTYEQLWIDALKVKDQLLAQEIVPHSNIILHLDRGIYFFVGLLGILMAGCTFVPIPTDLPKKRKQYIIEQSDASLIFSETTISDELPNISLQEITKVEEYSEQLPETNKSENAYILYTSGSTGKPKGVEISHQSLNNYVNWAKEFYLEGRINAPLFTSIGFDLTITSIFLPLVTGGCCHVYSNNETDASTIIDVLKNENLNFIKATPTHLEIAKNDLHTHSNLKILVVGGEDFKTSLARHYQSKFGDDLKIINEYGPTEATVGCIIHQYETKKDINSSVPIGKAITNMEFLISNNDETWVPFGVAGELILTGVGLANGYFNKKQETEKAFIQLNGRTHYKTGDIVCLRLDGTLEYLGRKDNQVKINGNRIELAEIEQAISDITGAKHSIALQWSNKNINDHSKLTYCSNCGLPSNYPETTFNDDGICNLCENFDSYQRKVKSYFKNESDLLELIISKRAPRKSYDCILLLSGGKDSTYALAKLIELNINVLAYTFDNGYISKEALANSSKICAQLGVELVIGSTPAMNQIFVDSLQRHSNVCNGCFKTIYTLATQLAIEKDIPFIVTGLSRGQFFETRLSEELFTSTNTSIENIDKIILNARKEYHRIADAVSEHLDVSIFEDDAVFEDVQFVDFYRFCDVELSEMLTYLDQHLGWKRPTDTGRSTNCLINQLGIFVHKKKEGYSNYAFPYSWDVRIGHKTKDDSIEEINEKIDEAEVKKMMQEIGYDYENEIENHSLVAYYEGENLDQLTLKNELRTRLPEYMIPHKIIRLETMPVSTNGKIDIQNLPNPRQFRIATSQESVAPRDEIEQVIYDIWKLVLGIDQFSVNDSFLSIGGSSLAAIRITSRVKEMIQLKVPLKIIFEQPTVAKYSAYITAIIKQKLNEMNA